MNISTGRSCNGLLPSLIFLSPMSLPLTPELTAILEAILFTADRSLSIKELEKLLPEFEDWEIKAAIERLRSAMQEKERGVELADVAGGYVIRSKAAISEWIMRSIQPDPVRLSRAAMETLAITAYRQPVTRSEIEEARGVDSSGVLRVLIDRGLIRPRGRKQVPGRPVLYGTTDYFLELFQLRDLDSLPDISEIKKETPGGQGYQD